MTSAHREVHLHKAVKHELDEGKEDDSLIEAPVANVVRAQAGAQEQSPRDQCHENELHKAEGIQEEVALDQDYFPPHERLEQLPACQGVLLLDEYLHSHCMAFDKGIDKQHTLV